MPKRRGHKHRKHRRQAGTSDQSSRYEERGKLRREPGVHDPFTFSLYLRTAAKAQKNNRSGVTLLCAH
jgi:hypothetical protein